MPNLALLRPKPTPPMRFETPMVGHADGSTLCHIVDYALDEGAVKTRCGRTIRHWRIFPYGAVTLEHVALCPRCGDHAAFENALSAMVVKLSAYHAEREREQAALYKSRSDAICLLAEAMIDNGFDIEVGGEDTARTFTITHEGSTFGVIVKRAAGQPKVGKPGETMGTIYIMWGGPGWYAARMENNHRVYYLVANEETNFDVGPTIHFSTQAEIRVKWSAYDVVIP